MSNECTPVIMTASTGSDWQSYNGAVWERTGSYYSHVSGGGSWLSGKFLYFLSGVWRVGSDVSSTSGMYAYTLAGTASTPVGTSGWTY